MGTTATLTSPRRCPRSLRPSAQHRCFLAVLLIALLATACSSGVAASPTTEAPLPAGPTPSKIATQICRSPAIQDIETTVGVAASISTPTWADHLYSCTYRYPNGSMVLSVKELSSWTQTKAYFEQLGRQMGDARILRGLGQAAFQTTDGSMVVRKDWKVLLVDTAGLPSQFGQPPTSSGEVAVTVADVILGCWDGD
jgi:hypothetical protein